jgi:hypothetical protein
MVEVKHARTGRAGYFLLARLPRPSLWLETIGTQKKKPFSMSVGISLFGDQKGQFVTDTLTKEKINNHSLTQNTTQLSAH